MRAFFLILTIIKTINDTSDLLPQFKREKTTEEISMVNISLNDSTISFSPMILMYALAFGIVKNPYVLGLTSVMAIKSFFDFSNARKLAENKTDVEHISKQNLSIDTIANLCYDAIILWSCYFKL